MTLLLLLAQALNLSCVVDVASNPRKLTCVEVPACAQCPVPTPTPTPTPFPGPIIDPVTGNFPLPAEGVCPAHFQDSFDHFGATLRSKVPVRTQGRYVGYRWNVDATPKSRPPYCPHAVGRQECEQWSACQDPRGADFWMSNPRAWSGWQRCDKASPEVSPDDFYCHHKAERGQEGKTTVCAVPVGSGPDRIVPGKCATFDVQP